MIVGIPTEVKDHEYRVAATPEGVREITHAGHRVVVQAGAGYGSAIADEHYAAAGATVLPDADAVFAEADLIVKVKEPQPQEYERFRPVSSSSRISTWRQMPNSPPSSWIEASPRSPTRPCRQRTAGSPSWPRCRRSPARMAPHVAAGWLERTRGGRGVLMGGAAGVAPATVVVLGAGMAGGNAAWIAAGMEATVSVVDRNVERLRLVDQIWRGRIHTVASSSLAIEQLVLGADVVVGAVLVPGAKAPHVVSGEMVAAMRSGAVLVDISIDQGGCFETSRMTTHSDPTYVVDDVVHYCVGNMPGAVPRTSTYALTNVTLPYLSQLATLGLREAVRADPALALGVNVHEGSVTNPGVAAAHDRAVTPLDTLLV